MKPTKKKLSRESSLISELSKEHGYVIADFPSARDQYTYVVNTKTGKGGMAVLLRLAVPHDSALGTAMIEQRKMTKASRRRRA